ncbi:MAG: tetratricopeptide repeat protein [Bacteroidetes bacterium]|nr:tetratricopeptide repeat protein [Bacteroidota bacterium]
MSRKMFILFFLFLPAFAYCQSRQAEGLIHTGNEYYKNNEYDKASAEYNKALQADPSSMTARFNQANSLYRQEQKVEAVQLFTAIAREASITNLRANAFYNKGVILSQQKNPEESIEAYKNALRSNPADKEARENLQKALLELKKKTPPQKQNEKKDEKPQDRQKQKQPQFKMSPKEAEQRLKLLQQKEKEVQQRLQKEKSKSGGSQPKDW